MMITADNGRLEQGGERVLIEGNVVIVRDADAKTDAARITTEKLLVLPDAGIARTDAEVKMDSATGQAVAQGLEIDNRARTMRLDRVVATYQPPRK
jgi:lipopolysaccharide export system protein LptC